MGANPWDALYKEIDPQTQGSENYDPEMYRTEMSGGAIKVQLWLPDHPAPVRLKLHYKQYNSTFTPISWGVQRLSVHSFNATGGLALKLKNDLKVTMGCLPCKGCACVWSCLWWVWVLFQRVGIAVQSRSGVESRWGGG